MIPPPSPSQSPAIASEAAHSSDHWLQAFRAQVRLQPDETAVTDGSRSLTFGDLDKRSDSVHQMLQQNGVIAGQYVGVAFHRGIDLIVALLAVVKSGAAYIPIDPAYPEQRISRMIESAGLETILANQVAGLSFPDIRILSMEQALPIETGGNDSLPGGKDPVYAIFTSGSTGQPKAASVFHSGFSNLLAWYRDELGLGQTDRTLVISSPSFDLTQKNLFTPLITGGTLVLDGNPTYDITRILRLIRDHGVTLINCTPSAFYPLVEAAEAHGYGDLATLRFAILGGEPISIPRLRAWLEHPACNAEVVNSYGPTECTDICLFHRLHRGNLDTFPFVPLGREIPGVNVTIRDEALAILSDGETGELCIEGAGVGGGYLNDPERTNDRFVNGIYRTGDLAKRLPCGTFEFRGRADHQVKVNGFRIELGEIEIALNEQVSVRDSVVTANGDRLTAYIQGTATPGEIRDHLATRLPAYMIPADIRFMEAFPLTPNGKVDRKALQETSPSGVAQGSVETGSSLEGSILSLWSEVLGRPVSDPTANFFDIGGNSIHLAVIHVRLAGITGREFPITDLFAYPSARAIAAHLTTHSDTTATSSAQNRARLAKSGFARFQRPLSR